MLTVQSAEFTMLWCTPAVVHPGVTTHQLSTISSALLRTAQRGQAVLPYTACLANKVRHVGRARSVPTKITNVAWLLKLYTGPSVSTCAEQGSHL